MSGLIAERASYVAGQWASDGKAFEVENPADETSVCEVLGAASTDGERAILAARESFDTGAWAGLPRAERARIVSAVCDHIESRHDELVATMIAEAGQPARFADGSQFTGGLGLARGLIDIYSSMSDEQINQIPLDEVTAGKVLLSVRRYEPIGVVAAITPYNAALIMAFQKVIPALLAGNSVVLRPSPLTPISSLVFGAAAEAAGIPAGVLNVVIEEGSDAATMLTTHPAVDMVSFTGSTAVGKRILAQSATTVKHVALELGGKSAQIYFADAIEKAAVGAAAVVAMTSGQACVAATRMLVPEESKADVLAAVSGMYGALPVGAPTDPATMIGPVISAAQRARCETYVELAQEHGGKVVTGGGRPAVLDRGYYFEPTVLDLPDNSNPAAQDEIFGPVLSVIGYRDIDHAVEMANDSPFGLSAQVYSADVAAATAVARRLRTGAVNVNAGMFSAYAPGGGYKESGLGRERGTDGVRAFQELKHMTIGEIAR
ncbi:MAG TPA: aldehyde dehydrogenase family protein [Mycobacteriales bacterium]|nr:aldehyde dehydrogenase family protein [Mycobacteriales bacterium]